MESPLPPTGFRFRGKTPGPIHVWHTYRIHTSHRLSERCFKRYSSRSQSLNFD